MGSVLTPWRGASGGRVPPPSSSGSEDAVSGNPELPAGVQSCQDCRKATLSPIPSQVPHTPTTACGGTGNERVRDGRPTETGESCRELRNFPTSRAKKKKMTAEKPKKKSPNNVLERDPWATADRCQALRQPREQTMTSQNPSSICIPCCPLGKVFASI